MTQWLQEVGAGLTHCNRNRCACTESAKARGAEDAKGAVLMANIEKSCDEHAKGLETLI